MISQLEALHAGRTGRFRTSTSSRNMGNFAQISRQSFAVTGYPLTSSALLVTSTKRLVYPKFPPTRHPIALENWMLRTLGSCYCS
ncbi:Phosducin-like protein C2A9.09 [Fusarium oxysporum f. sp. albedinis]|nr:Phosducin-like protein C2A9.09 [Fusarium oxysporum f. sp. albedinis]